MSEQRLRIVIALEILSTHFILPILLVMGLLNDRFTFEHFTSLLGIMLPITASDATIITEWILRIRNRQSASARKVNPVYAAYSIALVSLFLAAYVAIVALKTFRLISIEFETFKGIVIAIESVFGVYLSKLIISLFEEKKAARAAAPEAQA